ncbi:MAG: hypothetical protein KAY32_00935 [Candidatus Eisenbacteria sp.]|nr:hypothetical protein [Candidatus Eisenbacteria bacterium]
MAEVTNLKQVLVQALAVERMQEKSRRQSEVDQQQTTRRLADQAEIHGRQVEEAPEADELRLDPEKEGNGRPDGKPSGKHPQEPEESTESPESQDRDSEEGPEAGGAGAAKGRRIDLQA